MARYIFITGGVVSSLGKGLASAALGALLQARGYSVRLRKLDPYLNVDPGTMSPFEHGEVFVTDDGAETDLDLGHYERFTGVPARRTDSVSSGRIYSNVLEKERRGDYLGKTIQVIPHVTNEIKDFLRIGEDEVDFMLCEIGGTVGDIEGLPFFEAIRQFGQDKAARPVHLHAPDAAALPGGVRRAEDQADAALGQGAARHRHRARRAGLPLGDADPAEGARQAGALLQRPPRGGDRGAGPALDLRGAARLPRRGARPGGARRLRDLAGAAAEPREVGGRRRPHPQRRGRGAGRDRRQVHPARGRLQVDRRGADPRRHRQPGEGAGGVDRQPSSSSARTRSRRCSRASTPSWCPAASASAAPRARSGRRASPASARCPTSASASACRWRWSRRRGTCSG